MQRTEPFTDPQELKAFVSKLYVYLVDEMHIALNKVTHAHTHTHISYGIYTIYFCSFSSSLSHQIYSDDVDDDSATIQLSSSQLRHFAREAQLTGDYQQAAQYYQEVQ